MSEDLLAALSRMINEDGTPFPAPWRQVPEKYKKDFKAWVAEYKQQHWDGMWEKGWYNYQFEYLRFKIDAAIVARKRGKG